MIPMVLGSMGMKRIVVQVVNRWLPSRTDYHHAWPVAGQSVANDHGTAGLVLRPALRAVFTGNGQLNALFIHEYPYVKESA